MSIKRIFIAISAIFAASTVFADNSSVTSKKYVDDLMSGYQGKLPGSGANTLMIYDDETGIGEKSIEATLGENAIGVPTVGAVKDGLNGKQDTINGTAGYVMTGMGTDRPGEVGERAIYGTAVYSNSLVTAETVNTGVTNAVNNSLIRVDENGNPSDNGTLWEINTDLFALGVLPAGYTQLEWIESDGTQYIELGVSGNITFIGTAQSTTDNPTTSQVILANAGASAGRWFGVQSPNAGTGYAKRWGLGASATASTTIDGTTKVDFEITFSNADGQYGTVNAQTIARTTSKPTYTNWIAFAGHTNPEYGFIGKVWKLQAKQNNVLVRNLVPCKNSSNVVGMYDTVSGQFFTNQGGGNFSAGPAVAGN